MRISRSRFKQSKSSLIIAKINLCFAVICNFLVNFWGFLGRGLVKFGEVRNIEDLIFFLTLEFEVKN